MAAFPANQAFDKFAPICRAMPLGEWMAKRILALALAGLSIICALGAPRAMAQESATTAAPATVTRQDATRHFPGEPDRDFRRNGGAIAQYWCSEIWATRTMATDWDTFPGGQGLDMDEVLLDISVSPSSHGLGRIAEFWTSLGIYFDAEADVARNRVGGAINRGIPLQADLNRIVGDIAKLEARISAQGPIKARREKIAALETFIARAAPIPGEMAKLEQRLADASRMFNLAGRDRQGANVDELNDLIREQQNSFIRIRDEAKTAGVLDAVAATPADLVAALAAEKSFHEAELARELKELGVPEDDVARLSALKAERDALRDKIRLAIDEAASASDEMLAAELQLTQFRLVASIINACIEDQRVWLNGSNPGAPQTVELPGGERVFSPGDTITGSFKLSCDVWFGSAPGGSTPDHIDYLTGPMVAEFRDDGTIAMSLRARDPAGNSAHDTLYSATLALDPVTGSAQARTGMDAVDPAAPLSEVITALVSNVNGKTRISGALCSGPKPEHLQFLIETIGATTVCTGKFWGPEEMMEPFGPETSCGS